MSNGLAIATVSGALKSRFISLLIRESAPTADVFVDHPTAEARAHGVYVKLFRMEPNSALRNDDLPTRDAGGAIVARPRLALKLHYLVSFVGARGTLMAEHLAGIVALDLHLRPVLTPTEIEEFLSTTDDVTMRRSDLASQIERVRITPLALDNEQLGRIWGLFNQSFFPLSVGYEVSVVLLEPAIRPPSPKPVSRAETYVLPMGSPRITEVRSSSMAQPVVQIGESLVIRGSALRGPTTWLRIGRGLPHRVLENAIGVDTITFPITAALGLRAGVMAVQVVHRIDVDPDTVAESFRETGASNAVAFALVPTVTEAAPDAAAAGSDREIRLNVTPAPGADQEVELVLDRLDGTGHALSSAFRVEPSGVTVFTVVGLVPGRWLCRVRIDDAISLPQLDGTSSRPAVNVS